MSAFFISWLRGAELHLWQATLFGLLIAVVLLFLPGPAKLRYFAGWLALLRFLLPGAALAAWIPSLRWISAGMPAGAQRLGALWMPPFVVGEGAAPSATGSVVAATLGAIWATGMLVVAGIGGFRLMRGLRAVRHQAVPLAAADRARLAGLAARVGLRPGRVSGCQVAPDSWLGVVGFFRSRIVIPEGLLSALDDQEAESVLLHELMHVKRRDNLLRLCQAAVVAVFWFHPLVWWLDRRLRWESERACDEGVLRLTRANRAYATGLFKATRYALGLDLPGVSGMSRMRLQSRLCAVLNHQHRKDSPVKLALTGTALAGLFGLTALVTTNPATADETKSSAPQQFAAQAAETVYEIGELDVPPKVRTQTQPKYPAELKKAGVKGELVLSFVVDRDGNVGEIRVVTATDERFIPPATEAVRQWKFIPGTKNGRPVNVLMQLPIVFSFGH